MLAFFALISLAWMAPANSAPGKDLCPAVRFEPHLPVDLNDIEKKLVCGDPKLPAWQRLPRRQVELHVRAFLQKEGYSFPRFREEGGTLVVEIGDQARVKGIDIEGDGAPLLRPDKLRAVLGKPLTPARMNRAREWATVSLQERGFACPSVTVRGDPASGRIGILAIKGRSYFFPAVDAPDLPALNSGVLRRYDAFSPGKPFRLLQLILTENRNNGSDQFESVTFSFFCEDAELKVQERVILGRPRLVSFAFGYDTEEQLIGRAAWKNTRLGRNASSFGVILYGSFLRQEFEVGADWYPFAALPRLYLNPKITFQRRSEERYDLRTVQGDSLAHVSLDGPNQALNLGLGPVLTYAYTFRGDYPKASTVLGARAVARANSHDFEFYAGDPRSGWQLQGMGELFDESLSAPFTAQKTALSGELLANVGGYEPPLWVFGVRAGGSVLWVPRDREARVPVTLRNYMGGADDVRGFGRQELPRNGIGALSRAYAGTEMRLAHFLPIRLEPFVFVDAGLLGAQAGRISAPLYWSPGLGLRWASPLGTVRASLAHGYVAYGKPQDRELSHLQFHLNLWQEF